MLSSLSASARYLGAILADATSTSTLLRVNCHCRAQLTQEGGRLSGSAQLSTAAPALSTEQDRKNYEILQYLARRPAETALRIGALAGLSASYRDLSVVMDTLHDKDIGGFNFPEIAAQEAANTIKYLQGLIAKDSNPNNSATGIEAQLKTHLTRIIPPLSSLHVPADRAAAQLAISHCSDHDQLVINHLFPAILQASSPSADTPDAPGADLALPASTTTTDAATAVAAHAARIARAGARLSTSRVRYPIWDVTLLDDSTTVGQSFRPRHMSKLPWAVLLPPHVEMSYQTMTAIPLFPMQEASYPTHVDFDFAMGYLKRFARPYRGRRSRR